MKAMALQKKMHICHYMCIYAYIVYVQFEEEGGCFTDSLRPKIKDPRFAVTDNRATSPVLGDTNI